MKEDIGQFGAVIFGVAVGALAHFGRTINDEGWPQPRKVIGFSLQLALIALVAAAVSERLGITSDLMRSLTASLLTVSTNEVIAWARSRAKRILSIAAEE